MLLQAALFFMALLFLFGLPGQSVANVQSVITLEQEFKSLQQDPQKSRLREPWEKLAAKFDAVVETKPQERGASNAAFFSARCLEEIALRTRNKGDFTATIERLNQMLAKYPKSSLAPEALYKKAEIEARYLKNDTAAAKTLARLTGASPDLQQKAQNLQASLSLSEKISDIAGSSAQKPNSDKASSGAKAAPKSDSGSEKSGSPLLLSILANASDKTTSVELKLSTTNSYLYRFIPSAKTSSGKAALVIELPGLAPKEGLLGLVGIGTGPIEHINTMQAQLTAIDNSKVPSTRVELTLAGDYFFDIAPGKTPGSILVSVNSVKKQSGPLAGNGNSSSAPASLQAKTKQELKNNSSPQKVEKFTPEEPAEQAADKPVYVASNEVAAKAPAKGNRALADQLGLSVKHILLDPGHGGRDSGAAANSIIESKLALKFAKMVETRLKKQGFSVSYTRDKDTFISLENRTATANRRKVDLFISIHVNANPDSSVSGLETYYLDQARTKSAERLAARENGVSIREISDLQVILTDLGSNTKLKESRALANSVHNNMVSQIKGAGYSVRSNGVRSAPFYVLVGAKMPSILVEVGYCSNKADANYLKNDKYLGELADGVVAGIIAYRNKLGS